jgi:hypothetical protein
MTALKSALKINFADAAKALVLRFQLCGKPGVREEHSQADPDVEHRMVYAVVI